jgi:hypothetical protein
VIARDIGLGKHFAHSMNLTDRPKVTLVIAASNARQQSR